MKAAPAVVTTPHIIFAGFWLRTTAHIIDSIIFMLLLIPLLSYSYGWDYWLNSQRYAGAPLSVLLNYILPALAVICFWKIKSATPGKIATKLIIVDAETLEKPTSRQFIIRYFGYLVSFIPLCLGFFWVGWDKRKQGFHDKLAGTVVIKNYDARGIDTE